MKILMVCTVPTGKSGIPNVIFNLMSAFDRQNIELGYVSINDPPEQYRNILRNLGVELHVIPRKLSNPFGYIRNLAKVAKGYDIMHVHGNSATMVLEMIAAKTGVVSVRAAHAHNTSCSMKWCDRLARPLFYHLCNLRMACGEAAGRFLYGNREFQIVNNGIDSISFKFNSTMRETMRRQLRLEDKFVVGHIGNFVEAKNHSFLIDVFGLLHTLPNSRLLLLGEGALMDKTKKQAVSLGIENKIIWVGSVSSPEEYMHAMDVVAMPSLFEGLPLTMIEEQANGLSIIASSAITELANVTGNVKYLPLEKSKWVKELIAYSHKASRTERSSINAIESIANRGYDIRSVADNLTAIYAKSLK